MIRDDDAFTPSLEREKRIGGALNAFDYERTPAGDALPLLHQPRDLLPGMGLTVPDGRVDPLSGVVLDVLAVLAHEDRVGGAYFIPDGAGVIKATSDQCESQANCDASVHVVGDVDIRGAPAELPGVGGEHADVEAAVPCALKETEGLRER